MAVDWIAVEGAYRAGTASLRDMAAEFGASASGIRKRAQKHGWVQDPTGTKRAIVSSRMTGAQAGAQCALEVIKEEAEQDVRDMQKGLQVCRNVLDAMAAQSMEIISPGWAKTIMDATEKAVNTIRTIRELNAPAPGTAGSGAPVMIQIVAVGAQVRNG